MRDAYNPHAPLRPAEDPPLSRPHVLIVDDEELYRHALERILGRSGYTISCAPDAAQALEIASQQPLDLVICDVRMPGISGLELVRQIHDLDPDVPCIVVTGYGGAEQSVEALHAGAFWYLEKPFEQRHLDVVRRLVEQAIEHRRLRSENRRLQRELRSRHGFESIVGQSPALARVLQTVEKVAASDSTVLITGESGSGKELIAQAIHYNSARADRVLVTVNCGAIPEELLESELFGHVRGAFTNAVRDREGRFAMAEGGTIFLDEIGDMSPNLQVKLLRVLQERSFEPVGSSRTQRVDVRVIAATHQDLAEKIRSQEFREDLYYRLNVIPIEVPPLRERRDDIPHLIRHFLEVLNRESDTPVIEVAPAALERLCAYDWPGNVRELRNVVERLVVLCNGDRVDLDDLPADLRDTVAPGAIPLPEMGPDGLAFNEVVGQLETHLILQALERTGWNKNQAAQLLGLNRTTLLEKIKKRKLEQA
ncbi:MAG: sigma-54 dependent transcriptional regulator [Myxococcota bacterium]|nr:sigma-54 dependent transcriptional regulator [Myxococcota bacterium]